MRIFLFLLLPLQTFAVSWSPPIDLTPITGGGQIATNTRGELVVVCEHFDGKVVTLQDEKGVQISEDAHSAQVAIDEAGSAHAIWESSDRRIQVASRLAGIWGSQTDLSIRGSKGQIAVNAAGLGIAVWEGFDGVSKSIEVATYFNGMWSQPLRLSSSGKDAQVAISDAGNAIVTWSEFDDKERRICASIYDGRHWHLPEVLSLPGRAAYSEVKMNDLGDAIVAWEFFDGGYNVIQISRYLNGCWASPETISSIGSDAERPHVRFNNQGAAVSVWQESDSCHASIFNGEHWSEPVRLASKAKFPRIAMNQLGEVVVAWYGTDGSISMTSFVEEWSAPQMLSEMASEPPQVELNDVGDAFILWGEVGGQLRYSLGVFEEGMAG